MAEIKNTIKIKVKKTDMLLPQFLYYTLLNAYQQGAFRPLQIGVAQQGISVGRLKQLKFNMGTPEKIPFSSLISTGLIEVGTDLKDFDIEIQRIGDNSGRPFLKNESKEYRESYQPAYQGGLREVLQIQVLQEFLHTHHRA